LQSSNIILQSERLLFRKITYQDFDDLSEMLTNPKVMHAWEHTFSQKQINDWIDKQLEYYHHDKIGYFAVIAKENSEFIGQMGLHWSEMNGMRLLEVCYMLKQKYWHKGYALEGTEVLINYAFTTLDVNKIYAFIRSNNLSSVKVAAKAGMKNEGSFIRHYNGIDMEHFIYSKMREE
jgi:ribosomal-protein-alanine N-acetyltransferase